MFYRKPFVFINKHLNLHLEIVGGAALLFNGITGYETADIDTIIRISDAVQEIIDDYCIDINNDACDYIDDYDDCYWLEETSYSNISISYLSLGSAIKTKIKYIENPYIYIANRFIKNCCPEQAKDYNVLQKTSSGKLKIVALYI